MERINDNTIRVMVENDDLKDRGTSVRDLLSDRNKIESFFYNILSELDTEDEFVDNDKVSFQVLPNQNGLELFISRLDDEESLGNFLNSLTEGQKQEGDQDEKGLSAIDELSLDKKVALQEEDLSKGQSSESSVSTTGRIEVIAVEDFETLLSLTSVLDNFSGRSFVYRYKDQYFLSVDARYLEWTAAEMNAFFATLIEYGRFSKLSDSFLSEHGEVLFEGRAIQSLNAIFASR
ncbi:adaptor protein MecA [Fructobacillus sp. M1-13]|nr:adaptor protein MecA [Fructobacillus papyriferae]MCD2158409.1 adaptor protein MecA [Fructobacillus papyriferae]